MWRRFRLNLAFTLPTSLQHHLSNLNLSNATDFMSPYRLATSIINSKSSRTNGISSLKNLITSPLPALHSLHDWLKTKRRTESLTIKIVHHHGSSEHYSWPAQHKTHLFNHTMHRQFQKYPLPFLQTTRFLEANDCILIAWTRPRAEVGLRTLTPSDD